MDTNETGMKSLDRMAKDPRVTKVWSEKQWGQGYWASLAPGYNFEGCSSLHENNVKDLYAALARVEQGDPC